MKTMVVTLSAALIGLFGGGSVFAAPPDVQTPSPVIYLADNLDEVDQLGWCIDTVGRGLSDRLHAHSCKPRGGDVQFAYLEGSSQIASATFEGLCMAFRPDGTDVPLRLVDCDTSASDQMFSYDAALKAFTLKDDQNLCLAVGETSRSAGPFMSRDLVLAACAATPDDLKKWVIQK